MSNNDKDFKDLHSFEKKTLDNQFGIDAVVDISAIRGESMGRANRALQDIGAFIKDDCAISHLKDAIYMGSASIHMYFLPNLKTIINVCQVDPLGQIPEYTASEGFKQLKNDMREYYGRKRVVRRSGA